MRRLVPIGLVGILNLMACTGMVVGDSVLAAQGQLVLPAAPGASCTLTLLLAEATTSPAYYSRTIRPGAFKVDFTVEHPIVPRLAPSWQSCSHGLIRRVKAVFVELPAFARFARPISTTARSQSYSDS